MNVLDIHTYGNKVADVLTNGRTIDKQLDIKTTISNLDYLDIDFSETYKTRYPHFGGQKMPMKVTFTTPAAEAFSDSMHIKITLETGLITTINNLEPFFCNFIDPATLKEVRCKITDSHTTVNNNDIYFTV